jgi:dUTP pyrophosphatase
MVDLPIVRKVKIKLLNGNCMPTKATESAAAFDLKAALVNPHTIQPGEVAKIPCGFQMELPSGYEAQLRPRSGIAWTNRVSLINSPGTIDADYRGEVCALMINLGTDDFTVEPLMRVAQMVIDEVPPIELDPVEELSDTGRGKGGFGSTGV